MPECDSPAGAREHKNERIFGSAKKRGPVKQPSVTRAPSAPICPKP